jgi:hypothetical protein
MCLWQVGPPVAITSYSGEPTADDFSWVSVDLSGHQWGVLNASTLYWVGLLPNSPIPGKRASGVLLGSLMDSSSGFSRVPLGPYPSSSAVLTAASIYSALSGSHRGCSENKSLTWLAKQGPWGNSQKDKKSYVHHSFPTERPRRFGVVLLGALPDGKCLFSCSLWRGEASAYAWNFFAGANCSVARDCFSTICNSLSKKCSSGDNGAWCLLPGMNADL